MSHDMTTPLVVLTIAGSDSSGGAGVQADLRTFAAHGVHGASAFAALTAQNTTGVQGVHVVPVDFVRAQIASVLDDLDVRAVKTGMLATAGIVAGVGEMLAERAVGNLVVDPVMVSSTGARLLDDDAVAAYRDMLFPHARVITPNRHEAAVLCGSSIEGPADVVEAAHQLAALGPEVVVVTGGDAGAGAGRERAEGDEVVDVIVIDGEVHELRAVRIATTNDHGTGCSFAAATAARLARGDAPMDALRGARSYVLRGLTGAAPWRLGAGHGPIDHFGWNADEPSSATGFSPHAASDLQERT